MDGDEYPDLADNRERVPRLEDAYSPPEKTTPELPVGTGINTPN